MFKQRSIIIVVFQKINLVSVNMGRGKKTSFKSRAAVGMGR